MSAAEALGYAHEGRLSHAVWLEHLEAHEDGVACIRCTPAVIETAGDAATHREWVRKYDVIIAALVAAMEKS